MKFKKVFFFVCFILICIVLNLKIEKYLYQDKLVKIFVLSFLAFFFLICFFVYEKYSKYLKIFFLNFIIIIYSLNFLVGFYFLNNLTDTRHKKELKKLGINYDSRTQMEYIKDSSNKLFPMITPREIMQKEDFLILSNISNSKYVQCNEYGYWKLITTDEYGFNNSNVKKNYKILLSGDSFAHGFCVDETKEIHKILISKGIDTYSIGIAANGPMISLSSMIEINKKINFEEIYWLIYRNDFFDLNWELENKFLRKYLDSSFNGFNYFENLEEKNSFQEKFISKNKNQKKNFSYKESFLELKFLNDIVKKIFSVKNKPELNEKYIKQILKVLSIKFPKIKKTIVYLPDYNCFKNEILLCKMEYDLLNKISDDLNIKTINFQNYIDNKNFMKIFAMELNGLHYSDSRRISFSRVVRRYATPASE